VELDKVEAAEEAAVVTLLEQQEALLVLQDKDILAVLALQIIPHIAKVEAVVVVMVAAITHLQMLVMGALEFHHQFLGHQRFTQVAVVVVQQITPM
jgi:hypothetical protein